MRFPGEPAHNAGKTDQPKKVEIAVGQEDASETKTDGGSGSAPEQADQRPTAQTDEASGPKQTDQAARLQTFTDELLNMQEQARARRLAMLKAVAEEAAGEPPQEAAEETWAETEDQKGWWSQKEWEEWQACLGCIESVWVKQQGK